MNWKAFRQKDVRLFSSFLLLACSKSNHLELLCNELFKMMSCKIMQFLNNLPLFARKCHKQMHNPYSFDITSLLFLLKDNQKGPIWDSELYVHKKSLVWYYVKNRSWTEGKPGTILKILSGGRFKCSAAINIKLFVTGFKKWKPLYIATNSTILDFAGVLCYLSALPVSYKVGIYIPLYTLFLYLFNI